MADAHFNIGRGPKHKSVVVAPLVVLELRARRIALGLSQEVVALRCGYNPNMVQRWENGRVAPSINAVVDWAEGLGMEIQLVKKERE